MRVTNNSRSVVGLSSESILFTINKFSLFQVTLNSSVDVVLDHLTEHPEGLKLDGSSLLYLWTLFRRKRLSALLVHIRAVFKPFTKYHCHSRSGRDK